MDDDCCGSILFVDYDSGEEAEVEADSYARDALFVVGVLVFGVLARLGSVPRFGPR